MIYRFADCVVDTRQSRLYRAGKPIDIMPKVFDVLVHLLEQKGELVAREVLLQRHWPKLHISEESLTTHIGRIRRAIGHSKQCPLIKTVHGKGYCFVAELVSEQSDDESVPLMTEPVPEPVAASESPARTTAELPAASADTLSTVSDPASFDSPELSARTIPVAAERRQLTVLCCQRISVYDDADDVEAQYQYEQQLRQRCMECFTPLGGHLAQSLPNMLVFYFGYPHAFEDNAQRALLAALRLLEQLQPAPRVNSYPPMLQVRIGIHSGPMIVEIADSETAATPLSSGTTQTLAMRLCEQAGTQNVLISAAGSRLIRSHFSWSSLPAVPIGAAGQQLTAYRLTSVQRRHFEQIAWPYQGETPLVGREPELSLLNHYWAETREGMGHVVWIYGDPGIGKTRLLAAFQKQNVRSSERALTGRCSPYHQNTAWFPLLELLRGELQALTPDSASDAEQIEAFAEHYQLNSSAAVPLLAALLSIALPPQRYPALTLSPQQQRQQGMQLLLSWLLAQAQAQAQPLLLMIEDLHWADPSTLEFIELLIPGVATIPVMVVLTSRPEFAPGRKQQAPVTPLLLNRLNQTQIEQMLWRITHGKMLPAEIIEQIRRKTDGVPLFIEELTRMLLESGQLRETGQGFELATPFDQLSVPLTLEDSLRARLDQLDSGKLIAQWGSVIGREFSHQLLTALVPQEASVLQSGIRELLLAGLLYQQGLSPNTKYYFKHALIRDAAYQSMLKRQRQNIHREVAKTLKTQFPVVVAEHPELIAQHYTQAGLIKAAIPYWTQAGQKAARRWAHKEAIGHLTTALQLLKAVPDHPRREHQELTIRISLGPSLSAIHGPAHETVEQCFERARQLCREQGETAHLFPVITHLWRLHHSSARYRDARQLGEEMLIEARRQNDPQHLQLAYQAIGTSNYFLGELISGCNDLQKSLELADQLEQADVDSRYSEDPRVQCLAFLLGPLQYLGYPDQALQKSRQLLALAKQLRHPHSLAMALHFIGLFLLNRDDLNAAQQNNDALITLAGDHKFAHFLALGELMRGLIMIRQDQGEAGIARLRQGIIDFESTGSLTGLTAWRLRLAEAYSITGQPQRGLLAFNEAMKLMEQTGERFVESALYLQQGLLLLQLNRPDPVKAEACLLQALNVARRQQAKWWELRAAISLARLWRDQGKAQQACQLLAPVYEWFTEGFDTVYLKQAKGLLAQLQN